MAVRTLHLQVPALQWERCSGMIESRRRFPACIGMAFQAVLPYLSPMLILMAIQTGGIESQKCPVQILPGVQKFRLPLDLISFMAFSAIQNAVLALQLVARLGMIEILNPVRPPDQFVVAAQMLHVTGNAVVVALIFMQAFSA